MISLRIENGEHIGVVHRFIKRKFKNGETVIWGSNDLLSGSVTVTDLEWLAQEIKDAVMAEMTKEKANV